ncbi:MAG: M48 family metallopeptidase [Candidatus Omnitrophica bacterium]|nr:M48 family metallopeptidase [Candidatus Omnitrophota bacterium]
MKFVPKPIKGNVNVPEVSAGKEFLRLIAEILGVLLIIYIVLGLAVDLIAPRISIQTEKKIGKLFASKYDDKKYPQTREEIQQVLSGLVKNASLPKFDYSAHIEDSAQVNAMALPAGNIVVYSALLKQVRSKNELAMVLAHELGHFAHRDHLRGLGRGLIFLALSSVTLGTDSGVSKFLASTLSSVEMRFSQAQERAADIYAVELLYKTYGDAAGATDFYEKMASKEKISRVFYFFASHPYIKDRIAVINGVIREKRYPSGEKIAIEFPELAQSLVADKPAGICNKE